MASIFGHSIVALTITKLFDNNHSRLLILLAIVSAILPDLDVLAFNFGIPYEHPFGHRGFSHSILFALIWSTLITYTLGRKNKKLWFLVIFLSTLSHGILDAMTSGGRGVGFFIPFNHDRFFFPFREIMVSPLGVDRFFSEWGFQVILSELKYIFLPSVFVLLILHFNNKKV
ncbi:metal-dependent hydrolase [Yeosuana sp. MJ-SS3]|jgi:inner membrane protein|uniref:Metal-dependent hydrolase n=1 Tax=Gilvirhabdus luticola TaxID=3079858 RepID=A0ABU3U5U2_9FLAO|nr:metal-dependent hydrolase [Yeosuana sp. MJ-SS3]MDU8885774.1 metal-dependent hydrolase [Yeosuana sp. MJ-SS3]